MKHIHRSLLLAVVALLVVVPTAQAGLSTVLEDAPGDVRWEVLGAVEGPAAAEPLRDAAFFRNGTGADVETLRVGETATHILVEIDLVDLPPAPEDPPPEGCGPDVWPQCGFRHRVYWTFFREHDRWAQPMEAEWWMQCRPPSQGGCQESTDVFAPGLSLDGYGLDTGLVRFERVPPDRGRWVIDKAAFQKPEELPDPDELGSEHARLCAGDALLNFRVRTSHSERWPAVPHHRFTDSRDTSDTGMYMVRDDSPGCPEHTDPGVEEDEGPKPVVDDRPWDVRALLVDWLASPRPVRTAWNTAVDRNGSGADAVQVRVAENATHVLMELDLVGLPPPPGACSAPPGADGMPKCGYLASVYWTFYRRSGEPWAPEVNATWRVTCRPDCREEATVQVGDGSKWTTSDGPGPLSVERVPPHTVRWSINKHVFHREAEFTVSGEAGPSGGGLCQGDAFADFRASTHGFEEFGINHYRDEVGDIRYLTFWGLPFDSYLVQNDSPGCLSAGGSSSAATSGGASAERFKVVPTTSAGSALLVLFAVAALLAIQRRQRS